MLVLTRGVGEQIHFGEHSEIVLTVVGVKGGRVRLGIEADPGITVQRIEPERNFSIGCEQNLGAKSCHGNFTRVLSK